MCRRRGATVYRSDVRIGIVSPYSLTLPGGVQGQVLGLAHELRLRGHEVRVLGPCDGPPPDAGVTPLGATLPTAANGSVAPIAPDVSAQLRTIRALRDEAFEVVHLHEPLCPGPTQTAILFKTAPLVGTFHAAGGSRAYRFRKPLVVRGARRIDVRCAVSEDAREMAHAALGGDYELVFNGVDVDVIRKAEPHPTTGPTVLFLGRHEPRKGLGVLLEAMAHLPDEGRLWLASDVPEDPYIATTLERYFPDLLRERFSPQLQRHPLKREIIATYMTNAVVNRMGATFVNFLATEASCTAADVVSAYTLAREVFALEPIWDRIDALDLKVTSELQLSLLTQLAAITQRASRWMLRHRGQGDLPTLIAKYRPAAQTLRQHVEQWLPAGAREQWKAASDRLVQAGVDARLADDLTVLDHLYPVLDLVDVATQAGSSLEQAARTYFAIESTLGLDCWRQRIGKLPTDSLWQTQARASARDDVYSIAGQLVLSLLSSQQSLAAWQERHARAIERINAMHESIADQAPDLAPVSVALRELRQLA